MEYREADTLCDEAGMVLICWHPLEIELEDGSVIKGSAADLVLSSLSEGSLDCTSNDRNQ